MDNIEHDQDGINHGGEDQSPDGVGDGNVTSKGFYEEALLNQIEAECDFMTAELALAELDADRQFCDEATAEQELFNVAHRYGIERVQELVERVVRRHLVGTAGELHGRVLGALASALTGPVQRVA